MWYLYFMLNDANETIVCLFVTFFFLHDFILSIMENENSYWHFFFSLIKELEGYIWNWIYNKLMKRKWDDNSSSYSTFRCCIISFLPSLFPCSYILDNITFWIRNLEIVACAVFSSFLSIDSIIHHILIIMVRSIFWELLIC